MKKANERIFGIILAITMLLACVCPASAVVDTGTTVSAYLTGTADYANGVYAVMKTTGEIQKQQEIPGTSFTHVVGRANAVSPPETDDYNQRILGSFGCNATDQLGTTIANLANASFTEDLANRLGLTTSETHTARSNVSYMLHADAAAGDYCLAVIFPGNALVKQVTGINHRMFEFLLWQETVEYAPQRGESFVDIVPCEE